MSWRWAESSPLRGFVPYAEEPNRTGDEPEAKRAGLGIPVHFEWEPADHEEEEYTAGWREPAEFADARRRGYCGRAGVPNFVGDLIEALARNAERLAP